LPAFVGAPTPADGSEATSLLGLDSSHLIFRFAKDRADPLPSSVIGRYFPCTPREGARVLATYASGWPFLISGDFGHGRVLLASTPLDASWSTLPLSSFYLPLVQSSIRYLASGALPERNLSPGGAIRATADTVRNAACYVRRPDGRDDYEGLSIARAGGEVELRYTATHLPGIYQLFIGGPNTQRVVPFVVQDDAHEADLRPIAPHTLARQQEALGFTLVDPARNDLVEAIALPRPSGEAWASLIVLVLALGALEMGFTRLWSAD
jgi:hypothetical protein